MIKITKSNKQKWFIMVKNINLLMNAEGIDPNQKSHTLSRYAKKKYKCRWMMDKRQALNCKFFNKLGKITEWFKK